MVLKTTTKTSSFRARRKRARWMVSLQEGEGCRKWNHSLGRSRNELVRCKSWRTVGAYVPLAVLQAILRPQKELRETHATILSFLGRKRRRSALRHITQTIDTCIEYHTADYLERIQTGFRSGPEALVEYGAGWYPEKDRLVSPVRNCLEIGTAISAVCSLIRRAPPWRAIHRNILRLRTDVSSLLSRQSAAPAYRDRPARPRVVHEDARWSVPGGGPV